MRLSLIPLAAAIFFASSAISPLGGAALAQSRSDGAPAKSNPVPRPQIPQPKTKGADPVPPSKRAECAWIGQRVVSLLWRDDVNTAREQARFYDMFGCPTDHLPLAFRCVIEQSQNQPEGADINARVYGCWTEPEARTPQE